MKVFAISRRPAATLSKPVSRALLTGHHVLVVDDDGDLRRLLRTALELEGAVVSEADGVKAAAALAGRTTCDVVITDITMGSSRRDGLRLLQWFRTSPQLAGIPVIAMTGCKVLQPELVAAGFDRVLIKPFEVLDLPVTIHALLGGGAAAAA